MDWIATSSVSVNDSQASASIKRSLLRKAISKQSLSVHYSQ